MAMSKELKLFLGGSGSGSDREQVAGATNRGLDLVAAVLGTVGALQILGAVFLPALTLLGIQRYPYFVTYPDTLIWLAVSGMLSVGFVVRAIQGSGSALKWGQIACAGLAAGALVRNAPHEVVIGMIAAAMAAQVGLMLVAGEDEA